MSAPHNEIESWKPEALGHTSWQVPAQWSLVALTPRQPVVLERRADAGAPASDATPGAPERHVQVPRLDNFDGSQAIDRFRFVSGNEVSANSRIRRENDLEATKDNYKQLLQRMNPDATALSDPQTTPAQRDIALRDAAAKTVIFDLRTPGDRTLTPDIVILNDKDMASEQQAARDLGIKYYNRPMMSKVADTPFDLKQTADMIRSEVAAGNKVDIHCFHGTDRTGLVVAAYQAAYDPRLSDMVKNQGQQGVEAAYAELSQQLLRTGTPPATHPTVYQGLRQYLQFLHDGQNGNSAVAAAAVSIDAGQQQALRAADGEFSQSGNATMDRYMEILSRDLKRFDPATHNAYYRQLAKDFSRNYVAQH